MTALLFNLAPAAVTCFSPVAVVTAVCWDHDDQGVC